MIGSTNTLIDIKGGQLIPQVTESQSWKNTSSLPYNFYNGDAVVYNDEIHILGAYSDNTKHYKWDGDRWLYVSNLPYFFANSCAVVYNGEIHLLGSDHSAYYNRHYKYQK